MTDNSSSNDILGAMARQSDEIFFIYDLHQRRFTFVNDAFEEVTQTSAAQLYQNPALLLDIVNAEDLEYVKKNFGVLTTKTTSTLLDFRICRPDGVERWIRLKIYPIVEDGQVQYLTGEAEDDSARKTSIFNMQKITGWKNATLHIISHDLRGPIGVVKMLANELAKHFPNEEHKQAREWLRMIENISNRNLDLIKNVLSEESLSTAAIAINKERLDLVWEVKELLKYFDSSEPHIDKTFNCSFSHDQIFAEVDHVKFGQIVTNLVDNAMKFTRTGGTVKVHLEKMETTVLLTIEDNGIGIPRHLQPVLFKKDTQASRPGLKGEEPTGLGLWIVKSFTDAHQGRLWFETEEQRGTKFYVELPTEKY